MYSILVVEDEADMLELIEYTLRSDNHDVIGCLDTSKVLQLLEEENIDLIIMDRNLPIMEGSLFVQNKLRTNGYNQPVIYISAKDSDEDVLEGFKRGGDDYITKPFNLDVLKARVKALLLRNNKEISVLKERDILYKANQRKFLIENIEVKLSSLEHDLLLYFLKNKNIILSRDSLLDNVWEDGFNKKPKTVDATIKRLKEKIDPTAEKDYIQAIRGSGYIFC